MVGWPNNTTSLATQPFPAWPFGSGFSQSHSVPPAALSGIPIGPELSSVMSMMVAADKSLVPERQSTTPIKAMLILAFTALLLSAINRQVFERAFVTKRNRYSCKFDSDIVWQFIAVIVAVLMRRC
jgi:hypothetical protein